MKRGKELTILLALLIIPLALFPIAQAGPYRDYDTFISSFMNLANYYPGVISTETIGKTVNGVNIMMFKIGNPQGPRILLDGAIHGWESQGGEILYQYAKWLVTSDNQLARGILANTYTLLIPAVNPDNYNIIRQNAHGVDLNRNFPAGWESAGSTDPSSDYYRGPWPLSEPESQALEKVFKTYAPRFYVNLHAGGGPIIYASYYGNQTLYASTFDKMNSLSREFNVAPYPHTTISGPGEAMSYASSLGTTGFLLELGNGTRPLSEVETIVFPTFLPVAVALSPNSGAPTNEFLFRDLFETGDLSRWDGLHASPAATARATTTLHREGSYSALFSLNGSSQDERANSYVNLQPQSHILAGAYFLETSSGTTSNDGYQYFIMLTASGNAVAYAGWRRDGGILHWRLKILDGTEWTGVDSSSKPSLDHWYFVELYWRQDATNGMGRLYVDGTSVCQISALNTTAYGSVDSVHFGLPAAYNSGKTALYCDHAQVSSTIYSLSPSPYDIELNGQVDLMDVMALARAYNSKPWTSNWDPRTDLNADGAVDVLDALIISYHFGEIYN